MNLRLRDHGIIRMVNDKAGFRAVWLFQVLFLGIIDLHFRRLTSLGIESRKPCSLLKGAIRQFLSVGFHDHMAARLSLRMEPPVVPGRKFKGKLVVLKIILSHINVKPVGRAVVERA